MQELANEAMTTRESKALTYHDIIDVIRENVEGYVYLLKRRDKLSLKWTALIQIIK